MDAAILAAIEADPVVDITTTGRTSGDARRIEIRLRVLDGRIYLSGRPGRRSWYANLIANPSLTLHVKRGATADLPMRARVIRDQAERRAVFARTNPEDTEDWVTGAPLAEITEA